MLAAQVNGLRRSEHPTYGCNHDFRDLKKRNAREPKAMNLFLPITPRSRHGLCPRRSDGAVFLLGACSARIRWAYGGRR